MVSVDIERFWLLRYFDRDVAEKEFPMFAIKNKINC
jgi:hypothetical protein